MPAGSEQVRRQGCWKPAPDYVGWTPALTGMTDRVYRGESGLKAMLVSLWPERLSSSCYSLLNASITGMLRKRVAQARWLDGVAAI